MKKKIPLEKSTTVVLVSEGGFLVEKTPRAAALRLIRNNYGEVDRKGHVSGFRADMGNKTIFSKCGELIPLSDGVICQRETGGKNCHFAEAGKVIPVLRIDDEVIIPGRIYPLSEEAVPARWNCIPDRECPKNCANNSITAWRQPSPGTFVQ